MIIARTSVLLALVIGVMIQYAVPGQPLYQAGWYSVVLAALFVIALFQSKSSIANVWISGMAILRIGMGLVALAGIANGLLAPVPQTIVGAPGATIPVADLHGALQFSADTVNSDVVFAADSKHIPLCGNLHFVGSFETWCEPREAVFVQAFDAHGAHLTITQPTGTAFLSPVLLFTAQQTIAGIPLPYDSFTIPAAHRIVNAVYFDARHAAALRGITSGVPAILFALDDDNNQPLPHAIRLVDGNQRVALGDVQIQSRFLRYPAVQIVAVPLPLLALCGLLCIGVGMALHVRRVLTSVSR